MKRIFIILAMIIMAFMAKAQSCPDDNHPHAIDLGLPSGTKWACCNVDTDHPENQNPTNYGGYYAWGETETKDRYDWNSYIFWNEEENTCHDIGVDIAGTQYDVAHVKWGGSWVIPSYDQRNELSNYCTYEWTTENGIEGGKFTSKTNGASIFLPGAGFCVDTDVLWSGSVGHYWLSTVSPIGLKLAFRLFFGPDFEVWLDNDRYTGISVRPVINDTNNINLLKSSTVKTSQAVFNLYGLNVADSISGTSTLRPGIYIVNGKKKVIKWTFHNNYMHFQYT